MNPIRELEHALSPAVSVDPVSHVFGADYEPNLYNRLSEYEKGTMLIPVTRPEQLQLNTDCTTVAGGNRYTTSAFTQLCQLLAPGLAHLLPDLAGDNRRPTQPKAEFSRVLAADVFNRAVKLRFERVRGRQLVRNRPEKLIDGIVGPRYRYLSNLGFYNRVKEAAGQKAKFYEALLYGRYLVLRYAYPERRFVVSHNTYGMEAFMSGFHFVNSEIGEGSARAAPLFVRESTGDTCIGPFTGRVKHQGRDFDEKIGKLMLGVSDGGSANYRAFVCKLMDTSLGLGKGDKSDEKVKRHVLSTLLRRDLPQTVAERALASAIMMGAGSDHADAVFVDRQLLILARRSAYDVFTALMREGRALAVNAREAIEQVAYALLTARFNLLASSPSSSDEPE